MRYRFETTQWLPYPVPRVFAFFADPANLPRLMPAWQRARIDTMELVVAQGRPEGSAEGVAAGAGTRMTLSFQAMPLVPVRLKWDAEIAEFAWNDHFCDVQLQRGPFAYWRHCHRLQAETRNGLEGSLLTDHVEYALPLDPLSRIAHALVVRGQIAGIFRYRQAQTAQLLAE
jgi:ligand-binding SRPBCC domain-containing protein